MTETEMRGALREAQERIQKVRDALRQDAVSCMTCGTARYRDWRSHLFYEALDGAYARLENAIVKFLPPPK
jgi:hypothetical protein